MLTLKHIRNDGIEILLAVKEVRYAPSHFPATGAPYVWYVGASPNATLLDQDGYPNNRIEDGIVYVMNEAGRTVGTYRLAGNTDVPADGVPQAA